jgi:glutamine synthetase
VAGTVIQYFYRSINKIDGGLQVRYYFDTGAGQALQRARASMAKRGSAAAGSGSGIEELKAALAGKGVKYALASYVDIHGKMKAKCVPLAHLDRMMSGSELFTGAALDGVPQDVSDNELAALPDPGSCTQLPWKPELAWFASDLHLNGEPFEACSRNILKRQLDRAAQLGLRFNLGVEMEYFLLKDDERGQPIPVSARDNLAKPCYDLSGLTDHFDYVAPLVEAINGLGWDVYSFDHEDGNGQFEIDFQYAEALTMADRFVFFRYMAHELARASGYYVTFMPKPFADRTGSGAHFNMSLADPASGENLFETSRDSRGCGLSKLGYHFIGGILKHASAVTACLAPTVNSYKRLVKQGSMTGSTWAPVFACYGGNNRTNMLRIPSGGGRVECRAADIAANPYLGAAIILAAGLEGVEREYDPGEPHMENLYRSSDEELRAKGVALLPRNLLEAVEALERDPLAESVLGKLMLGTYAGFKRREWESYHSHVSDWERERYLKFY